MILRRAQIVATGMTLSVTGLTAVPAAAAAPTFTRITVDDQFQDDFLTAECGVPVTTSAQGVIVVREREPGRAGPTSVRTINIALTSTSGDNTYRFRDVGADVAQVRPDGDLVLLIAGKVPFGFTGALKVDPETGEVLLEPRDLSQQMLEEACAALTA